MKELAFGFVGAIVLFFIIHNAGKPDYEGIKSHEKTLICKKNFDYPEQVILPEDIDVYHGDEVILKDGSILRICRTMERLN